MARWRASPAWRPARGRCSPSPSVPARCWPASRAPSTITLRRHCCCSSRRSRRATAARFAPARRRAWPRRSTCCRAPDLPPSCSARWRAGRSAGGMRRAFSPAGRSARRSSSPPTWPPPARRCRPSSSPARSTCRRRPAPASPGWCCRRGASTASRFCSAGTACSPSRRCCWSASPACWWRCVAPPPAPRASGAGWRPASSSRSSLTPCSPARTVAGRTAIAT